jgi:hypothetical protein
VFFLMLCSYPLLAVLLRDYESDMAMTTVFLGVPCLLLGTVSGVVGLARGHSRCKFALGLMWGTVGLFFLASILVAAFGAL